MTADTSLAQLGEIVILEGNDSLVSSSTMGLGLTETNLHEITKALYLQHGDDFDEVIVYTTFDDMGVQGALAYEISTQQEILNIGQPISDDNMLWGSSGRLHAFVNMMRWNQFETVDVPSTDPRSDLYSTLGQEFAHRWVAFLKYKNAQGQIATSMLGRDAAHWSSTLQADASVIDGNRIVDNGDGTFTIAETMARYSPLDQYAMGLIPPTSVPPFFIVDSPTTTAGVALSGMDPIPVNAKIKGTREDITIDQVVAAMGPRMPSDAQSPHAFRVAFVLVTKPGERAGDVLDAARTLDGVRKTWETVFSNYTAGHGTMCTQVTAPCGDATAQIVDGTIVESGGNHNGVVEPGEPVTITFTLVNSGITDATGVQVAASGDVINTAPQTVDLAAGAQQTVTFSGMLPATAQCGQPVSEEAQSSFGAVTGRGLASVVPGRTDALMDDFENSDGGFSVAAGTADNGWQYGTPVEYKRADSGFVYQPGVGSRGSSKAWFTGLQEGHRAMGDSSLGVGSSVLLSPIVDLSKTYQPQLRYFAWFQAIDYTNPMMPGSPTDAMLYVEGSSDGGRTWVSLDTVTQTDVVWQQRTIPLASKFPSADKLQVRYTINNPVAAYQVEAGIDDFEIVTLTGACNPSHGGGGCSCDIGRRGSAAPTGAVVAFLVIAASRFGRRRRRLDTRHLT